MIRNAIIHIANEQPLVADLFDMPTAADVSLVCTNVRMLGGKKPVFIDHTNSVFVFPYVTIRFIELVPGSTNGVADMPVDETTAVAASGLEPADGEADLELDEDFLRRVRDV